MLLPINIFLEFLSTNYIKIIVGAIGILFWGLIYLAITGTLKRLKTDIFQYYPFDPFFPHSGEWSIGYFLLIILSLGLLIIFLSRGNLYPGPA